MTNRLKKERKASMSISIPPNLIDDFDFYSRLEGSDRSKVLTEFVENYINKMRKKHENTK